MVTRPRSGFTLIEMLIVISVIAILSALLIAGIGILRKRMMVTKTGSIIATVRTALGDSDGTTPRPSSHPLAATAVALASSFPANPLAKARFSRAGQGLDTQGGESLHVAQLNWVAAGYRDRVVRPSDRYAGYSADGDVPMLFGLRRDALGIMGVTVDWIHQVRRLPAPKGAYAGSGNQLRTGGTGGYGSDIYPDREFLEVRPYRGDTPLEKRQADEMVRLLASDADKIADLKALSASPDADTSAWLTAPSRPTGKIDVEAPTLGSYDAGHRVWLDDTSRRLWQPGFMMIDGSWRRYHLRGSHLVDAWGRELLFSSGPDGDLLVYSAGADGCFLIHPGSNYRIDTDIATFQAEELPDPGGDDRLARRDNIGGPVYW